MSLSYEQKNTNILNRFDSQVSGSKISRFSVKLNTHNMTVISLNGMTLTECEKMLNQKYADRVVDVKQM